MAPNGTSCELEKMKGEEEGGRRDGEEEQWGRGVGERGGEEGWGRGMGSKYIHLAALKLEAVLAITKA